MWQRKSSQQVLASRERRPGNVLDSLYFCLSFAPYDAGSCWNADRVNIEKKNRLK